jgi:hypothetical protein
MEKASATEAPPPPRRPQTGVGEDLCVALGAVWLVGGLFIDGWSHRNNKPESFFNAYHLVFYSGYAATAVYALVNVWRRTRFRWDPAKVPSGYGLTLVGIGMFLLGALGDLTWHVAFGIEASIEALLSPTHLIMYAGGLLLVSAPLRAAWEKVRSAAPSLWELAPGLVSLAMISALAIFFLMHLSAFLDFPSIKGLRFYMSRIATDPVMASQLAEDLKTEAVAAILVTNLILLAPLVFLACRWRPPPGSATLVLVTVSTMSTGIDSFESLRLVLAPLAAGLVADTIIALRLSRPAEPRPIVLLALVTPLVLWCSYFALLPSRNEGIWTLELWTGTVVMATYMSVAFALLVLSPVLSGFWRRPEQLVPEVSSHN